MKVRQFLVAMGLLSVAGMFGAVAEAACSYGCAQIRQWCEYNGAGGGTGDGWTCKAYEQFDGGPTGSARVLWTPGATQAGTPHDNTGVRITVRDGDPTVCTSKCPGKTKTEVENCSLSEFREMTHQICQK